MLPEGTFRGGEHTLVTIRCLSNIRHFRRGHRHFLSNPLTTGPWFKTNCALLRLLEVASMLQLHTYPHRTLEREPLYLGNGHARSAHVTYWLLWRIDT